MHMYKYMYKYVYILYYYCCYYFIYIYMYIHIEYLLSTLNCLQMKPSEARFMTFLAGRLVRAGSGCRELRFHVPPPRLGFRV